MVGTFGHACITYNLIFEGSVGLVVLNIDIAHSSGIDFKSNSHMLVRRTCLPRGTFGRLLSHRCADFSPHVDWDASIWYIEYLMPCGVLMVQQVILCARFAGH